MSRLLTVYNDANPLNNVIVALSIKAEKVIFLSHDDIPKKKSDSIRKVLNKYLNANISFVRLLNDREQIEQIIENNDDLIVDIGGARYLSLLVFEIATEKGNQVVYYDNRENCIKDYRAHSVLMEKAFSLQIEDVINLGGGNIVKCMHKAAEGKGSRETIIRLVESNLKDYAGFVRYITKLNSIANESPYLGNNTYKVSEENRNYLITNAMYQTKEDLFIFDKNSNLRFKNGKLREMVSVSGSFLENYLYIKLTESGKFDDVMMSVVIDFSNGNYKYPICCEIDALIIKDNRLLFVSCKSSKASADDLNEIYVHNRYFGNILSLPVLCVLEEMDLKNPGIYAKGEELGVYLVDRSSFTENDISEVFASILDGTYTYDEVL